MTTGLILLVFIGLLVAFLFTRLRRRMGLPVTGRMWLLIVAAVMLAGLFLWASATHQ